MSIIYDGEGKCLDCGYELKQLTVNRCPECGRTFDPGDETTLNVGRKMGKLACRLFKPVGWRLHMLVVVTSILTIFSFSGPTDYAILTAVLFLVWLVLGGLWFLRAAIFIRLGIRYKQPTVEYKKQWKHWLIDPMIVIFVLGLLVLQIPRKAAYHMSRSAMNQLVAEVLANPEYTKFPARWVGVYHVNSIERNGNAVSFIVTGTEFAGHGGYCYSPDGKPQDNSENYYRHIEGDWYRWVCWF